MDTNVDPAPSSPFLLAQYDANAKRWLAIEAAPTGLVINPMDPANPNQIWVAGSNPINSAAVTVRLQQGGANVTAPAQGGALVLGGQGNSIWYFRQINNALGAYTITTEDIKQGWQVDSPLKVGESVKCTYNFPATAVWVAMGINVKAAE